MKPPAPAKTVKKDAEGALAPSQADAKRDGSLTIEGSGDADPDHKAHQRPSGVAEPTAKGPPPNRPG